MVAVVGIENTGREVGKHSGWDASPSQDTMHAHTHSRQFKFRQVHLLACTGMKPGNTGETHMDTGTTCSLSPKLRIKTGTLEL